MSLLRRIDDWAIRRARAAGYMKPQKRGYGAAGSGDKLPAWASFSPSADGEVRYTLRVIRARSRDLSMNNDYFKKFLALLAKNVVGQEGIQLKNQAKDEPSREHPAGRLDTRANTLIENEFYEWGQAADITGKHDWTGLQQLGLRATARDGESLFHVVRGKNAGNPWGFALRPLEADLLDEELNETTPEGNKISMGVERDGWSRPVRYHLLQSHPGDPHGQTGRRHVVVPAEDLVHVYTQERAGQTRGVPWGYTAMKKMHMLNYYEEAELDASAAGACQGGFVKEERPEGFTGDKQDEQGNEVVNLEPNTVQRLAPGDTFIPYDPKHPTSQYEAFVKEMIRSIASGLDVSYAALASDLTDVNFSSIRAGVLDERDAYRILQQWYARDLHRRVFTAWLEMALLTGQVALPFAKFEKFNRPYWVGRGWSWVDPLKDIKADIIAIDAGLKTRTQSIAERGGDIEDTFKTLESEQALAKQHGLDLSLNATGGGLPEKEEGEGEQVS